MPCVWPAKAAARAARSSWSDRVVLTRLRVWFSVMSAWAAAIGALYLHPGLWALFAVLLALFLYLTLRASVTE